MYKPLPSWTYLLKIQTFRAKEFLQTRDLHVRLSARGHSHYRIDTSGVESINEEENKNLFIRTPLGGFINHSDTSKLSSYTN